MAIDYRNVYSDYVDSGDVSMDKENPNVSSPYTGTLNEPTSDMIMENIDPLQTGMDPSSAIQTGISIQSQGKKILENLGIENPFANPYATEGTSGFAQTEVGGRVMFKEVPTAEATAFQNQTTNQIFQPDQFYTESGQAFDSMTSAAEAGVDPATLTQGSEMANTVPVASTSTGTFLNNLSGQAGGAAAAKSGSITALAGTALKMISDDKDATTLNVGETVGTGLQGGGTGVALAGYAAKAGIFGAAGSTALLSAIPVIGIAAAAFTLLRAKKKRDEARKLEKEKEIQNETFNQYRDSFDNYAARRQRFLADQNKQQQDAGLKNTYSA